MKIAFTGHRPQKTNNEWDGIGKCSDYIRSEINKELSKHNDITIISGMALGVDMIAAEIAISKSLPLIAAIPFIGQERMWQKASKDRYNGILGYSQCTKHIVCEGGYAAYKMQVRNEWMVNNCDLLIAVFDGTEGGTANCVKYAKKVNKQIVLIDPTKWNENV